MIDKSKEAYHAYRQRAGSLYESIDVSFDSPHAMKAIHIPTHANVQICEDGAFVEAIVWVPKEEINAQLT